MNNTGRKHNVLQDELKINGGGIYCIMPYERLDRNKKAVFKIGLAINFKHRLEQYHTYFPLGYYMSAFLINPPIPKKLRSKDKETPTKRHYLSIEKFIFDYVTKHGGQRIYSTTRVRNPNQYGQGESEWLYANEKVIHEAFLEAQKKYQGKAQLYYLEGLNPQTGKFESINDNAKANEEEKPHYAGKIIFHYG